MRVADYMVSEVTTLPADARLLDAALLIRRTGRRHIPIVDDDNRPVGIISDRDVARMAPSMLGHVSQEEYNEIFEATPISRAMTKDPITVTADTPVHQAVELLHTKKIGALLVVEEGRLVGILTVTDMLGLLYDLVKKQPDAAS